MAGEGAPNIYGESVEQAAARTGYSPDELRSWFPPIEEWPVAPKPGKLADTFAAERFKAPPKPGVHPRIYFGPDDLPAIRTRLEQTQVGRLQMAAIRGRLLQVSPRREDWESVPYKPKQEDYERYASRGMHIEPRMGYRGPWMGGWVNALAAGRVPDDLEKAWDEHPNKNSKRYLMHLMPYEAFRCMIDEDEAGGKRIAAAAATLCARHLKSLDRFTRTSDWQAVYAWLSSHSIGLTYDWAHRWMTDAQRDTVRKTIAAVTRGKAYLGLDHPPGFPGNTSNWNIIHANLLPLVLAIEGEEGYDAAVAQRIVEGLRKWVYVASGPQGAPFEGLNKSAYGAQWLLPLAGRGAPFLGTEYARNHARKFLLHTMVPWGGEHVVETGIGGLRADIRFFKFAHPKDPVIDILYAATVRERFAPDARGSWPNIRTTYAPLWTLFVADDPIGAQGASYDFEKAYDRVLAQLRKDEPLTWFSDYRGLVISRSAWSRDALHLCFEPRHVPGGHTRASRNEFVLSGLGRLWAHRTVAVEDTSELHSVVLVDGKGQGKSGGRCPAGRTVAFADSPLATFAAADAAWAYSRLLVSADKANAQPVPESPNDHRLARSPLPWMSKPWSVLPNWATGCKPAPGKDPGGHGHWVPYNPVAHAYRTCGLVRGEHPYVLVLDDLRRDDAEHLYEWLMQVPGDLVLDTIALDAKSQSQEFDVILKPQSEDDGRRLLVRVLQAGDGPAGLASCRHGTRLETYGGEHRRRVTLYKRLVLPLRAATAHYKVLLFPHRERQKLPLTTWDAKRTELSIVWPDQQDVYSFGPPEKERTTFTLRRTAPGADATLRFTGEGRIGGTGDEAILDELVQ